LKQRVDAILDAVALNWIQICQLGCDPIDSLGLEGPINPAWGPMDLNCGQSDA